MASIPQNDYVEIQYGDRPVDPLASAIRVMERRLDQHIGQGGSQHAAATEEMAGFMSAVDKQKMEGIQAGATRNSPDEFLLNRGNHTGLQAIETVEGLRQQLDDALAGGSNFRGLFPGLAALQQEIPVAAPGNYADVDEGQDINTVRYIWDDSDQAWVSGGEGEPLTAPQVKALLLANPNTNVLTDQQLEDFEMAAEGVERLLAGDAADKGAGAVPYGEAMEYPAGSVGAALKEGGGQAANGLRQDLANTTDPSKGAGMIGWSRTSSEAPEATVAKFLEEVRDSMDSRFEVTPEKFYMPEDGADWYPAFLRMITAVNAAGAGVVNLAPGKNYLLDQYLTPTNGVTLLRFRRLKSLKINGNGAKILFKGDYNRVDPNDSGLGIWIDEVDNLLCENLTGDGQVQLTTRTPGLIEAPGTGLLIRGGGSHVYINTHMTRMSCDGFQITPSRSTTPFQIQRRTVMIGCTATENARQGCSVIGGLKVTAISCLFRDTGFSGGAYGYHMPGAGFWIEPNLDRPDIDERTYDCELINCHIMGNAGHQLGASGSLNNGRHFLHHCRIDNEGRGSVQDAVFLGGRGWDIYGTDFYLNGDLLPHINIATGYTEAIIRIKGGSITSNGSGLYRADPSSASRPKWLTVEDVDFIDLASAKPAAANATFDPNAPAGTYFPQVKGMDGRGKWSGNRFTLAAARKTGDTGILQASQISGLVSTDNVWNTPFTGSSTNRFNVNYAFVSKIDDYYPKYSSGLAPVGGMTLPWHTPSRG